TAMVVIANSFCCRCRLFLHEPEGGVMHRSEQSRNTHEQTPLLLELTACVHVVTHLNQALPLGRNELRIADLDRLRASGRTRVNPVESLVASVDAGITDRQPRLECRRLLEQRGDVVANP